MDLTALAGLTGRPRRAKYLQLKAKANAERRLLRRARSPFQEEIAEMRKVSLLPPKFSSPAAMGLSEAERRRLRNALKTMRQRHRRG